MPTSRKPTAAMIERVAIALYDEAGRYTPEGDRKPARLLSWREQPSRKAKAAYRAVARAAITAMEEFRQ